MRAMPSKAASLCHLATSEMRISCKASKSKDSEEIRSQLPCMEVTFRLASRMATCAGAAEHGGRVAPRRGPSPTLPVGSKAGRGLVHQAIRSVSRRTLHVHRERGPGLEASPMRHPVWGSKRVRHLVGVRERGRMRVCLVRRSRNSSLMHTRTHTHKHMHAIGWLLGCMHFPDCQHMHAMCHLQRSVPHTRHACCHMNIHRDIPETTRMRRSLPRCESASQANGPA